MAKEPCEQCDRADVHTEHQIDPYAHDLFGEETMMWLCDDCHEDRCLSI